MSIRDPNNPAKNSCVDAPSFDIPISARYLLHPRSFVSLPRLPNASARRGTTSVLSLRADQVIILISRAVPPSVEYRYRIDNPRADDAPRLFDSLYARNDTSSRLPRGIIGGGGNFRTRYTHHEKILRLLVRCVVSVAGQRAAAARWSQRSRSDRGSRLRTLPFLVAVFRAPFSYLPPDVGAGRACVIERDFGVHRLTETLRKKVTTRSEWIVRRHTEGVTPCSISLPRLSCGLAGIKDQAFRFVQTEAAPDESNHVCGACVTVGEYLRRGPLRIGRHRQETLEEIVRAVVGTVQIKGGGRARAARAGSRSPCGVSDRDSVRPRFQ